MKNILCKISFLLMVYTMGIFLGFVIWFLRVSKIIKVVNWDRFPKYRKNPEVFKNGLIVVSNHPSLLEPIIVSGLFWKHYFWHPIKLSPWNVPEEKNYKNKWWQWASARIIWVNRSSPQKARETFNKIKNVLKLGGVIVIFPEGGRTEGGSTSPVSKSDFFYSEKGKKIRQLKEGVGLLARVTNVPLLFLWSEGSEKIMPNISGKLYSWPRFRDEQGRRNQIIIKIGNVLSFDKSCSSNEITQKIASTLLELADEESS